MVAGGWIVLALCVLVPGLSLIAYVLAATIRDSMETGYFSVEARARRARRPARISDSLRIYARAGDTSSLLYFMQRELPAWRITSSLVRAVDELSTLERATAVARSAGVPLALSGGLAAEARKAAEAMWRVADRVAAAGAQQVESTTLLELLARDADKVDRVAAVAHQTRQALAELTLSGTESAELGTAELRLGAFCEAVRDLS
jgi:hypothetical protein